MLSLHHALPIPNPDGPLDLTVGVMAELQDKGKVRCLGVSNFTVRLMQEAVEQHGARIVNNQVEYHPLLSQRRVLEFVRRHDMFLTAYAPLARGEVTRNETLARIGGRHGKSATQAGTRR